MQLCLLLASLLLAVWSTEALSIGTSNECSWGVSYWCQSYDTAVRCGKVQHCNEKVWKTKNQEKDKANLPVSFGGGVECEACKIIVGYVDRLIENNSTENETEDAVLELCEYMKSDVCTSLVKQYFPTIWDELVKNTDPDKVCGEINLCDSSKFLANTQPKAVGSFHGAIECDACKEGLKLLEKFFTEDTLEKRLDVLCTYLNVSKSDQDKCKAIIRDILPLIWDDISDPETICKLLGMCDSSSEVGLQTLAVETKSKSVECQLCDIVVGFIEPFVDSNATQVEVKDAVEKVCALVSYIESECKDFVEKYFPRLWALVESEFDNDKICSALGICTSTVIKSKKPVKPVGNQFKPVKDEACTLCKDIVDFIRPFVERNGTQDEVQSALDLFCSVMPSSISRNCTQLVDTYFPMIWQLLELELDSDSICKEINLCISTSRVNNKLHFKALKKNQPKQVKSDLCDVCTTVVNFVKPFIENNNTEAEAEAEVEQLCSELPSVASVACDLLVKTFFPDIWNELVKDLNSDVCKELGLCDNSTSLMKTKQPIRKNQPKQSVLCDVCTEVVSVVKSYILNNNTEAEAEAAVENLCSELPSQILSTACDLLVKTYFPDIWNELVNDLSSDVCQTLGFCSNSTLLLKSKPIRKIQVSLDKCDICQTVVSFLKHFVDSNSTEDVAKTAVEAICKLIPTPGNVACDLLVEGFFDRIWDLLHKEVDANAKEICTILDLCKNSTSLRKKLVSKPKVMDDDGLCVLCDYLVAVVNVYMSEGYTEEKAEVAMQNLCKELFVEMMSACFDVVHDKFPVLWNAVKKNPSTVCKDLGLCKSTQKHVVKVQPKVMNNGDMCMLCQSLVGIIKVYRSEGYTEEKAKVAMQGVCQEVVAELVSACSELVRNNFTFMWNGVKDGSTTICKDLGLCTSTKIVKVQVKPVKQDLCDLCKMAANFLKTFVDSNSSENEVKDALESLCHLLPSDFSRNCESVAKNDFDFIWKLVKDEVDSGDICNQLGLCNSTSLLRNKQQVTSVKVKPVKQDLCDLCKMVVNFVKPFVDSSATEKEVENAVEEFCSLLPGDYAKDCDKLINESFPLIWSLVKSEVDSGNICKQLGLCNSTSLLRNKQQIKPVKVKPVKQDLCDLCKLAANFIKPFVDSNAAENEVKDALESLCHLLPSDFSRNCEDVAKNDFDFIWKYVKDEVDSGDICNQIGLCDSTSLLRNKQQVTSVKSSIECILCEYILKELDSLLNDNSTEQEIISTVEKVCEILPSTIKTDCDDFIEKYGDKIIKLIVNHTDPDTICSLIQLCTSSSVQLKDTGECDVCKSLLGFLKSMMKNDEDFFEHALSDYCGLLPGPLATECKNLVLTYGADLIDDLADDINPDKLCQDVKLCTATKLLAKGDTFFPTFAMKKHSPRVQSSDIGCDVCTQVLEGLEVLLPKEKNFLTGAFSMVCKKYLPEQANEVCQWVIVEFGDELVKLIADEINPREDCQAIKLCKSSPSLSQPWRGLSAAVPKQL